MSFIIIPDKSPEYKLLQDKLKRLSFTYLHGKLEDDAGYDCYGILDSNFELDKECNVFIDYKKLDKGIYPCTYNDKKCSLYFWKCSSNRPHGLVIYDTDKKSLEYVKNCYNDNDNFI